MLGEPRESPCGTGTLRRENPEAGSLAEADDRPLGQPRHLPGGEVAGGLEEFGKPGEIVGECGMHERQSRRAR